MSHSIAYYEELIASQAQIINFERARRKQLEEIISNKKLPLNMRQATFAVKHLVDTSTPDEEGWYRAHLPKLADTAGSSASTMSRAVRNFADCTGAIEIRKVPDKNDPFKEIVYIKPTEILDRPAEIEPIKEIKKHGGLRVARCNGCGSENIIEKKYQVCGDCGEIYKTFEDRPVNAPLQDATRESESESETNFQILPDALQDATFTIPSTPPIADADSLSSQKGLQAEEPFVDIEKEAAQLLLEIAGQGPADEHIEMCKRGPEKYTTIKRALNLGDLRAHLRGYKTKGATLQHGDNTRAIVFDADTPEGWQRLQEAAQLLAIVDFKPILEPSPVPDGDHAGGGHLWIIFDAPVDAYSAVQTIYQYTGSRVQHIKEYWPREGNHRVRLPGGKYVKPGFEAWCKLYDANGNELSHDGTGAAAVLLDYQTPAGVVNEYTKPEPTPAPQRAKETQTSGVLGKDVAAQVIADFNASHSWADLLGQPNRSGKYCASWRGDRTPNVAVDPRTDRAKDFSIHAWIPRSMDKYQVHCFIEGGENWQEFKRLDLARRCAELRELQEPDEQEQESEEIPTTLFAASPDIQKPAYDDRGCPTRLTYCCNVPFQLDASGKPECSNLHCPEKQERRAS